MWLCQPVKALSRMADDAIRAVSIVITTKGRPGEALIAVRSALAQDWPELEVLLFDDDPSRGAARLIERSVAAPGVRVFTTDRSRGLIINRNRGFAEARGEIVFSLDDDAYFSDPETVRRTMAMFAADPTIGAVALPYVEPAERRSSSSRATPFRGKPGDELRAYVGCAHALRRDVALQLGGYRDFFVHQVEERDLSMRLWANGWRIVCGAGGPVVHKVDPRRDDRRVLYYACRNQLLNEFLNTPLPALLLRVPWLVTALLRYRFTWSSLSTRLRGFAAGIAQGLARRKLRRPMPAALYRRYRALPAHGALDCSGPLPPPLSCRGKGGGVAREPSRAARAEQLC